jgi:hypothetical protein
LNKSLHQKAKSIALLADYMGEEKVNFILLAKETNKRSKNKTTTTTQAAWIIILYSYLYIHNIVLLLCLQSQTAQHITSRIECMRASEFVPKTNVLLLNPRGPTRFGGNDSQLCKRQKQ